MEKLIEAFTSIEWWVSVVIVGIAINLCSAYLKKPFDGVFEKGSGWWANRTKRTREANERWAQELSQSLYQFVFATVSTYFLIAVTIVGICFSWAYLVAGTKIAEKSPNMQIFVAVSGAIFGITFMTMMLSYLGRVSVLRKACRIRREKDALNMSQADLLASADKSRRKG